jgi:hypothetical protein
VLDGWAGESVAVRIVAEPDELIAVYRGRLGRRSDEKRPSSFWPLEPNESASVNVETPGVYLHPHLFGGAELHVGSTVLEWRHGDVTTNVRRL